MNLEAITQEYNENGCAVVRQVLNREDIAQIEKEMARLIRDVVPTLKAGDAYYEDTPEKPIKSLFRLHQHSDYFAKLQEDPRLTKIVGALWPGAEFHCTGVMYFGKSAKSGSVTPAHQDNAFQNMVPPEVVIVTVAIDESTPANGVLTCQKGSHKLGVLPHRPSGVMGFSQTLITPVDKAKYPEIPLAMKPGDICLHHTNVIHYSGANTTDKSRRQLGLQFYSNRAKRDEVGWAKYRAEVEKLHAEHEKHEPAGAGAGMGMGRGMGMGGGGMGMR